ncbi:2325_t:CDS:2 [Funneliformis geosporum]|nr:2325_t:CDS:2 [Funneliformis geosporum]
MSKWLMDPGSDVNTIIPDRLTTAGSAGQTAADGIRDSDKEIEGD